MHESVGPWARRASTLQHIAFDAHKRYTLASVARLDGRLVREEWVEHERGLLAQLLTRCDRGSPVAVETTGNWYWIVDEIEAAGVRLSTALRIRSLPDGRDPTSTYTPGAEVPEACCRKRPAQGLSNS